VALAIGLMASLPLLVPVHRLPVPSFESEWLALLFGVLGLLAFTFSAPGRNWQLPPVALAPLALALLATVQGALGMLAYAGNGALVAACLCWAALLAGAGRSAAAAFGRAALADTLACWVLAGGLASALAGAIQYAGWHPLLHGAVAAPPDAGGGLYGNLAQQNHFATQLALALGSALYLHRRALLGRAACLLLALPLAAMALLSGSRSTLLYFGWIAVALLASTAPALRRRLALGLGALMAAAALLLWLAADQALLARLGAIGEGLAPRLFIWEQALRMAAAHPWLGVGFDGFAHALVGQLREGEAMWGVDQYAHNLPLQLLAVGGVAALAALVLPGLLWLRRVAMAPACPSRLWGALVLGVLAIHSLLEQPLYYAYFLGLAAFAAGMLDPVEINVRTTRMARLALGAVLVLAVAVLGKTGYDYHRLSVNFYGIAAGDTHDAAHRQLLRELQRTSLLRPMAELIGPELLVRASAPARDKLALNTRLMRYAPIGEVMYRQAALLAEDGKPGEAMAQFDQAARAWPDEVAQYVPRFAALAQEEPALYGALAAHALRYAQSHPPRPR
jgi:O-antigen ligase